MPNASLYPMMASPQTIPKQYKYLGLLTVLYVTMQLVSDVTAGKIVQLAAFPVSATVLYFPITYIFADILTEVYGYSQARRVLWTVLACSFIACCIYQLVVYLPPAPGFTGNAAYAQVLGQVPRILVGSWVAIFAGEILNNAVLAKMKVWTNGKHLWSRLVGSTVLGQFVNTALFYTIALFGILPTDLLINSILTGWVLKVLVEIALIPATYWLVAKLKAVEQEDYFDRDTDLNPFAINH
jgi:queuosine precursor transporter